MQALEQALARSPAVLLVGPRQVGKTTLALELAARHGAALYLDLERPADRARLAEPEAFLLRHEGELVILDEIHRVPGLFPVLRGLIDRGRRRGLKAGRFLLLGSAALELLRQSGESLAGRIAHVELSALDLGEVGATAQRRLWQRGGFPDSFLAGTASDSFLWRQDFIRSCLERELPQFGPRIPAETLGRLWTMLAHGQGGLLNASRLASGLAVTSPTVSRYIDLLCDLMLVRRLLPWHANTGKRLVKSPRIYVRDSGLLHALLGIADDDQLDGHPVIGPSWEGFVIENLLAVLPPSADRGFYRTAAGAEIDLVIAPGGKRGLWAIEVKYGAGTRPGIGFHNARRDLAPARSFVVHSGEDRYPLGDGIEAIGLADMQALLATLGV